MFNSIKSKALALGMTAVSAVATFVGFTVTHSGGVFTIASEQTDIDNIANGASGGISSMYNIFSDMLLVLLGIGAAYFVFLWLQGKIPFLNIKPRLRGRRRR